MLILALIAQAALAAGPCHYDRAAMLALDQAAFDQDMTGGWRKLEQDGCEAEAADLIRDWRIAHKAQDTILFWHEGQLRADIGQTAQAIALFRQSYKPAAQDRIGWNHYVDGTIAFHPRPRRLRCRPGAPRGLAAARRVHVQRPGRQASADPLAAQHERVRRLRPLLGPAL
ncbi:hypothetical protein MOP88_11930 [Sphingomonas sp. WKB10]|nr:hypothetical protein [Sphingomonas sp. WKB10]